jgi:hypothetical protein
VNEIVFVQLAPAGSGFGQVDAVFANELAFTPVTVVVAVKLTAVVPVFFTVIICVAVLPTGVEAKLTALGLKLSAAPDAAPVPLRATVWGLPAAVSVYVTTAVRLPAIVGVNEIVFVQLAPAGSGFGQVDAVLANELAFTPVTVVVAVKLTAVVPMFFTVIICIAVLPTAVEANVTALGLKLSVGPLATPVPLRDTVCGLPAAESE